MNVVYADNAATTRVDGKVCGLFKELTSECWGNPSSLHSSGRQAREVLEEARNTVAAALDCLPSEVYFTSGGTESDNWAILGAVRATGKKHVITSSIEHPAVLSTLKNNGIDVSFIPVDGNGFADPDAIKPLIRRDTALITLMYANNETGAVQPVAHAAQIAHEYGIPFHTDAVQACGHIPVSMRLCGADSASLSGHKFNAPKGTGVLFLRRGAKLNSFISGGEQENGMRAGTVNVPGAAALAEALKIAVDGLPNTVSGVTGMRNRLKRAVSEIDGVYFNTPDDNVLPGHLNVAFSRVEGEGLMLMLDMKGICVSTGSACTSGKAHISHVLKAMGRTDKQAMEAIRISLDRFNTEEDTDCIIKALPEAVESLRRLSL